MVVAIIIIIDNRFLSFQLEKYRWLRKLHMLKKLFS